MKKGSSSLPILVLVAVVALVLGSFGTATAAGMTKSQVKKIAKKVVYKEAPKLSVAHATTANTATNATSATNATNLNGQPASAYQTATFMYRLPTQPGSITKTYNFPGLPNGTYLFTYNFVATGGDATNYCVMRPTAGSTAGEGQNIWSTDGVAFRSVSASGVIAGTGAAINLFCAGASFAIYNVDQSSSVTFTRIDSLTSGTATAP
jgi:hypothetical protein